MWGAPMEIPGDADAGLKECLRLELETKLQEITDLADEMLGNPRTSPGDANEAELSRETDRAV
tara:strand:+ start:1333 stop:1521 length:189 start_codon:yes stop_codon:yes gene_type:complete